MIKSSLRHAGIAFSRGQYSEAIARILDGVLTQEAKNTLTLFNIGRLSTTKPLEKKTMGNITVQDITDAMEVERMYS